MTTRHKHRGTCDRKQRRNYWEAQPHAEVTHFKWTLHTQRWTAANVHTPYDSFRGMALKGRPAQWCLESGFRKSATFSINLYGEAEAMSLAKLWCHRMQHMYNRFIEHAGEWPDPDDVLAGYCEPQEAEELERAGAASVQQRLARLRSLIPRRLGALARPGR